MIEREFAVPIGRDGGGKTPQDSDGADLFAIEVRDDAAAPEAPAAVILHGGPGASHDYLRPQLDRLGGPETRLVYYDQRGGGRSTLPASWPCGVSEHVRDLHAVIDTLPDRPMLVGYSWGGLLALNYALEAPQRIARLLLIAPAPPNFSARDVMRERLAAAPKRPDVQAFLATLDTSDRRQRFAGLVAGYFWDPRRALELSPFVVKQRAERGVWDSLAGYDLRPRLPSLSVPALILHGVDDPIPIESARETAALSGARLVELPQCGHVPYIEGGDAFFDAARAFIRDASS